MNDINVTSGRDNPMQQGGVLLAIDFHADKIQSYRDLFERLYQGRSALRPPSPSVFALSRLGVTSTCMF